MRIVLFDSSTPIAVSVNLEIVMLKAVCGELIDLVQVNAHMICSPIHQPYPPSLSRPKVMSLFPAAMTRVSVFGRSRNEVARRKSLATAICEAKASARSCGVPTDAGS